MSKDDVKRLARRPGLIAGIYNYCDRWCERCPFTARCMNCAMQEEDSILDILVHLERLRKAIEKAFSDARAFQRPGFDYIPENGAESV